MRVLLISPNRNRFPYPVHPIGLDYVAGALSGEHELRVLDLCPLADGEEAAAVSECIRAFRPQAIGISCRNIDNADATDPRAYVADLTGLVRTIRAETCAPVVLGGPGYTLYPQELLTATGADHGVVGEGERAAALFSALAAGRSPDGLSGVVTAGSRAPVALPPPLPAPGLRALPSPNPALPHYLASSGILGLQTQRGCRFRCVYCSYPLIEGRELRLRPAADVAREALALQAAGARYLFLADSVFNGDPGHSLAVAEALRRAGLGIPWGAYFAPLAPPPGFYERMAGAGCSHVEFGTDSLSDVVLGRIRKAFRRDDALRAHREARSAGLHVAHYLILGGPGETTQTLDETLETAASLRDGVFFFFCGMRIYRGTELERLAVAEGRLDGASDLLAPCFYRPEGLSLADVEERVRRRAAGRSSWLVGDGEAPARRAASRLYARGRTGPLWEHLVGP